jgi:hypothetical protein
VQRSFDAEKMKLSSDGGDSGSKKCKRGYVGAYSGVWRSLRLAEIWSLESGGRFCVGAFGRNLASLAVKMFSHLIYFKKKCYKCCNFNAICKDNAAIRCITFQLYYCSSPRLPAECLINSYIQKLFLNYNKA